MGGVVPAAGLGFGERVRGENCPRMKNHDDGWTARKWKSLRAGWACPCGGFWVLVGVAVGLDG